MIPKTVDGDLWRAADAAALEERVTAIQIWIVHTENLIQMFDDVEEIRTELLSVRGRVRAKSNDLREAAEKIRADLADRS